jgi:phosphoenolpyruvate carboxykinase (ATP)
MKLAYTRAMIRAALEGKLEAVNFEKHPIFGVLMPTQCPDVPNEVLNPRNTWANQEAYDNQANHLAELFTKNFQKYADFANAEILAGAPLVGVGV